MTFNPTTLTAEYQPRQQDTAPAVFEDRLRACVGCKWRFAHTCNLAKQQCTVLARLPREQCPLRKWRAVGDQPQITVGQPGPSRQSSHVLPPPAGEPIVGPVFGQVPLGPVDATVRNLICHLYPVTAGQKWRRTVAHLAARRHLFNGRRLVAVAIAPGCDTPGDVEQAFAEAGLPVEIMAMPNNADLGEVVSFPGLLQEIVGPPVPEPRPVATFYCHGKGTTWPESSAPAHEWADAMFEVCLDHWPLVARALETAAITGAFRRREPLAGSASRWHFSGTFFWFRQDQLPANFGDVEHVWSGVEGWPGLHFGREHSACLFLDEAGDLYEREYWDRTVRPALRKWREQSM